jgi:hypothetical protein
MINKKDKIFHALFSDPITASGRAFGPIHWNALSAATIWKFKVSDTTIALSDIRASTTPAPG